MSPSVSVGDKCPGSKGRRQFSSTVYLTREKNLREWSDRVKTGSDSLKYRVTELNVPTDISYKTQSNFRDAEMRNRVILESIQYDQSREQSTGTILTRVTAT